METAASTRGCPAWPTGTYRQGRVIKKPDVNGEIIKQKWVIAQHRTCKALKHHMVPLGLKKNALSSITAQNLPCFIWELIPSEIGLPETVVPANRAAAKNVFEPGL